MAEFGLSVGNQLVLMLEVNCLTWYMCLLFTRRLRVGRSSLNAESWHISWPTLLVIVQRVMSRTMPDVPRIHSVIATF